jgi:hypothetical protein
MINSPVPKMLFFVFPVLTALLMSASPQPGPPDEPADSAGPRVLEKQTRASVERDYVQAWRSLGQAFSENRPDLLDGYFVGIAKEKLADAIREQQNLKMQTVYSEPTHDFKIVFYSPDGLSIQLVDKLEYWLDIRDQERVVGRQQVRARYVVVMTPTETRWKVRILQAEPQ